MHDENVGPERHEAHRLEILERIVRDFLVEAGIGDEARACKQQRGAVVRRSRGGPGADIAVRAAAVLDHERLAETVGELLREDAARGVHASARGKRQDDTHRPLRVGLS